MLKLKEEHLVCSNCNHEVLKTDDFCPQCGDLLESNIPCAHHHNAPAEGVCIICIQPLCVACGNWVNGKFLCVQHAKYEIIEGMARILGVSDEVQAQHAESCLKKAGIHVFVFSRKASAISLGGPSYTLFRASGDAGGHIINEIKVMVPCQEVLKAEKILRSLDLLSE
jgi:hypothetical protein